MRPESSRWIGAFLIVFMLILGFSGSLFIADEARAQPIFVTNTPRPPDTMNQMPQAPLEQYALRLWTEQDMLNLLMNQLGRLAQGEADQARAIPITLFELEKRFPGAPRQFEARTMLVERMLAAPRGSLDMRSLVQPYLVVKINEAGVRSGAASVEGFLVELSPANFNGDQITDALVHVIYPAGAADESEILYEGYIAMAGNEDGAYDLIPGFLSVPSAPYGDVQAIELIRQGDVNQDRLDEFAIAVDSGDINRQLLIFGWRNGQIVELTAPGERIRFSEISNWSEADPAISVANARQDSARWNCISELTVTWNWQSNFYRPSVALNARYTPVSSIGCALLAEEPVFARSAEDGITLIQSILNDGSLDGRGVNRAGMALAMFYVLAGDRAQAEQQAAALVTMSAGDPWLTNQLGAFTNAASDPGNVPVVVCAAMELAARQELGNEDAAACDVDQVITQIFVERPVPRAGSLVDNLNALGLPVLETTTISQVGFADRTVVNFAFSGASWWAFAPTNPDFYIPSPTATPPGFGEATLPAGPVQPPADAYEDIAVGDLAGLITVIDNAAMRSPDMPLSAEARYLQAWAYDLLGDRQRARAAYFALWSDFGDSTWGQLAGAHLELR